MSAASLLLALVEGADGATRRSDKGPFATRPIASISPRKARSRQAGSLIRIGFGHRPLPPASGGHRAPGWLRNSSSAFLLRNKNLGPKQQQDVRVRVAHQRCVPSSTLCLTHSAAWPNTGVLPSGRRYSTGPPSCLRLRARPKWQRPETGRQEHLQTGPTHTKPPERHCRHPLETLTRFRQTWVA
ncbi:MAG: hypothetical protein FD153_440 [Rhodospirillaceae bacterium]|nr:MAG: hypothetical protein FD153_440 [Rhodospirillaceae bacterium]